MLLEHDATGDGRQAGGGRRGRGAGCEMAGEVVDACVVLVARTAPLLVKYTIYANVADAI